MESPRRVLVIDDDKSVADTCAMVLNISGFEAVAVYSGEEALELARTREFEFLITDVVMHPMNGIEAAIEIRTLQSPIDLWEQRHRRLA